MQCFQDSTIGTLALWEFHILSQCVCVCKTESCWTFASLEKKTRHLGSVRRWRLSDTHLQLSCRANTTADLAAYWTGWVSQRKHPPSLSSYNTTPAMQEQLKKLPLLRRGCTESRASWRVSSPPQPCRLEILSTLGNEGGGGCLTAHTFFFGMWKRWGEWRGHLFAFTCC